MQGGLLLVWTRFRAGAASRYELIVTGDLVVKAVEALLDALEFFKRYLALLAEDLPARFIRGVAFHERLTMLKLGPTIGLRANSKASAGKEKASPSPRPLLRWAKNGGNLKPALVLERAPRRTLSLHERSFDTQGREQCLEKHW